MAIRYTIVLFVAVCAACTIAVVGFLLTSPAAEAAEGKAVMKCGGGRISLNAKEERTFALQNQERRKRNLRALCVHPQLQKAARAHSNDMLRRDYFSHNTKGSNRSACDRVRRAGYRFRYCGENIALGSGTYGEPSNRMRAWMKSSSHRRNILSNKFREVGIGVATGTYKGTRNTSIYTVDFGTRR